MLDSFAADDAAQRAQAIRLTRPTQFNNSVSRFATTPPGESCLPAKVKKTEWTLARAICRRFSSAISPSHPLPTIQYLAEDPACNNTGNKIKRSTMCQEGTMREYQICCFAFELSLINISPSSVYTYSKLCFQPSTIIASLYSSQVIFIARSTPLNSQWAVHDLQQRSTSQAK